MAKLWPLPSSTVVSARRTDRAGMRIVPPESGSSTAPLSESSLTSGRTRRFTRSGPSTVGTKPRLTPNCLNWMVIVPVNCGGHRHRELAAGEEARRLAGLRGEVGLGQDRGQPILRQHVDDGVDVVLSGARRSDREAVRRRGRVNGRAEDGVGGIGRPGSRSKAEHEIAGRGEGLPVEAQIARDLARNLHHPDAEVDLRARQDLQLVQDLQVLGQEAAGDRLGALRLGGRADRPAQDVAARHGAHPDGAGAPGHLPDRGLDRRGGGPRRRGRRRWRGRLRRGLGLAAASDRNRVFGDGDPVLARRNDRRPTRGDAHDEDAGG